jgi:hypothetical protein
MMYSPAPVNTHFPSPFTHQVSARSRNQSPAAETPSTMLSTTSSSDFGRTLAFAVAECVLDDLDDHLEVFKRSDRVLRESFPPLRCYWY